VAVLGGERGSGKEEQKGREEREAEMAPFAALRVTLVRIGALRVTLVRTGALRVTLVRTGALRGTLVRTGAPSAAPPGTGDHAVTSRPVAYMINIPISTPAALSGARSAAGDRRANRRHSSYTTSTIAPAPMAKKSVVHTGE
jgi:hypothetical protein